MKTRIAVALVVIALIVGLWLTAPEAEHTCPNYGEVPVLIDGGYECIPWEEQR
jgi:hypothetical protein